MKNKKELWFVSLLVLSLSLVACGDEDEDDHSHSEEGEHGGVEEEGCEHMGDGPAESVTAVADASSSPPDVSKEHTRHDVALADGGVVTFNADETGDFVVFLSANDVPLTIESQATGAVVMPEASEDPFDACDAVAVSYTYELEVGSYNLSFGSSSATSISVVIEHAGEEHAHEE